MQKSEMNILGTVAKIRSYYETNLRGLITFDSPRSQEKVIYFAMI